ncbi:MAG: bacteriohopanetetrol glucosamine biosynthesis glycosyltransferase HpnI [Terriglobales bacterium]
MPSPPLTARFLLEAVAAIGTAGSLVFYFLSALGLASFLSDRREKLRQAPRPENQLPAISILKPLKGVDPGIWDSFCSHCEQQYPQGQVQLVFGVSDPNDPAIELVRKLQAKYPSLPIELVVCDRVLGANIKVSNLVQMLPAARHGLLLVNDSDIRVPPDYLQKVIAPLADASVGLVTCLYRASPTGASPTLGSRLEALGISTDFVPGVLSARFLEKGLHFGLGSTLAFRRRDLVAIGGFEALLDYLADDYELGRRIAATGKKVELSAATVTTFLPAYTLRQFFRHQLRWSRTIRDARRWGYAGLIFTFGLPWALVTLLAARGAAWAWLLFGVTLAARLAVGLVAAEVVLHDRQARRNILLLPLRDLIAPVVWTASFVGNRIHWRGDVFDLKDGRLTSADPEQL